MFNLLKAAMTDNVLFASSFLLRCQISVNAQMTPSESNIPIKGGNCVSDLKSGTDKSPAIPKINTVFFSNAVILMDLPGFISFIADAAFLIINEAIISGTMKLTRLGMISFLMIFPAVIWPPIHSMVVVTSPGATRLRLNSPR